MISKLIEFYHLNPYFARLKKFLQTNSATSWFVPIVKRRIDSSRARYHMRVISSGSLKARFSKIYEYNLWADNESVSGEGSNLHYTAKMREELSKLLVQFDIKSIVDAPCGDFNWMRFVLSNSNIQYHGFDIVDELVFQNTRKFGSRSIQFSVADICQDQLPPCDLLITRDCLFHLSYSDIDRYLRNINKTDYRFLLTTRHLTDGGYQNSDIISGDFRQIDLFCSPFTFRPETVIYRFDDYPAGHPLPREMILIAKSDVPRSLSPK